MFKTIMTFLILATASVSWASKARLTALGQDADGSFFLQDSRNIFLNPAQVNLVPASANFEMGQSEINSVNGNAQAEGGFVYKFGGMNVGVQLGREGNGSQYIKVANAFDLRGNGVATVEANNDFMQPQNVVEIIVGNSLGSGTKWGASLIYGAGKDKETDGGGANDFSKKDSQLISLRGGLHGGNWQGTAYFDAAVKSNTTYANGGDTKLEFDGKTNIGVAGSYNLDQNASVNGSLDMNGFEIETTRGGNSSSDDFKNMAITVNYVRQHKVNTNALFFYSLGLLWSDGELDRAGTTPDVDVKETSIPLTIGLETPALSWLDLRASVKQNVIIDNTEFGDEKDEHNPNSTVVGAGASVKYDKLTIDATLAGATTGAINGNSLLANASLNYQF